MSSVPVVGALVVLGHHSGYEERLFIVDRVYHDNDPESGFVWGLEGSVIGEQVRLFAPELFPEKKPAYKTLLSAFPPRSKIAVWYNPKVTGTLFQHRSLNVFPQTENFIKEQILKILKWFVFCILPLVFAMFFARKLDSE